MTRHRIARGRKSASLGFCADAACAGLAFRTMAIKQTGDLTGPIFGQTLARKSCVRFLTSITRRAKVPRPAGLRTKAMPFDPQAISAAGLAVGLALTGLAQISGARNGLRLTSTVFAKLSCAARCGAVARQRRTRSLKGLTQLGYTALGLKRCAVVAVRATIRSVTGQKTAVSVLKAKAPTPHTVFVAFACTTDPRRLADRDAFAKLGVRAPPTHAAVRILGARLRTIAITRQDRLDKTGVRIRTHRSPRTCAT